MKPIARRPAARAKGSLVVGFLLLVLFLPIGRGRANPTSASAVALGDAAWADRATRLDVSGRLADPVEIEAAISQYQRALATSPEAVEVRWKLLRALHYSVDFAQRPDEAKDASLVSAIEVAQTSENLLAEGSGSDADRARLYFWSSIAWGTRANRVGILTVVREGAARRMYDGASRSLALDPSVDDGGALRLLSRLHGTLPKVPFVTGWVDRGKALVYAERAFALDPEHPGSRLVLAVTLQERAPDRADEARALLEAVASLEPRPAFVVEDLSIREQARERLQLGSGMRKETP